MHRNEVVYCIGLIGEEENNSFKTYHFDCRGSTVALTNECGNITDTIKLKQKGLSIRQISRLTGTPKGVVERLARL